MSRLSKSIADKIVENSLEIYYQEVENLKQKGDKLVGLCPIHEERTGSFYINTEFPYGSHCFGCGFSSNVLGMIKEKYDISYSDAIKYVENLKIDLNKTVEIKKTKEKKELIVDWCEQKFTDQHKRYFEEYELDEAFLNSRDIWALKTIAFNKRIQKFSDYQFKFAYFASDINQIKVLTLGKEVLKEDKWRSLNIPSTYLWNYWRYKDTKCDNLFVVKSNKDGAVLAKLGRCAIELQSEDAKVFLENNVEKVKLICNNPIICTGTDNQGFNTSLTITKQTGFRWFNVKKKYYKKYECNDVAELVKVFSLKKLEEELKIKGL